MKSATHRLRGGRDGDGMKTDNGDYYSLLHCYYYVLVIIIGFKIKNLVVELRK